MRVAARPRCLVPSSYWDRAEWAFEFNRPSVKLAGGLSKSRRHGWRQLRSGKRTLLLRREGRKREVGSGEVRKKNVSSRQWSITEVRSSFMNTTHNHNDTAGDVSHIYLNISIDGTSQTFKGSSVKKYWGIFDSIGSVHYSISTLTSFASLDL